MNLTLLQHRVLCEIESFRGGYRKSWMSASCRVLRRLGLIDDGAEGTWRLTAKGNKALEDLGKIDEARHVIRDSIGTFRWP